MKKGNKKDKKKYDKTLLLLFGVLVLSTIILISLFITRSNDLDTESKLIVELHNYFNTDDLENCEGLFNYTENKIEYDDISYETKMCLTYHKISKEHSDTEKLKSKKGKDVCKKDDMVFKTNDDSNECIVTKIAKDAFEKTYTKLYGKKINDTNSFKIDNLNICFLNDNYYYCGLSETFTYVLGNESIIYRVIDKAEEKGSNIIIYDYFIKINDNTCFNNYTTSTINKKCTEEYSSENKVNYNFLKNNGIKYKHIYNKSNDGSYYWISSEPIN